MCLIYLATEVDKLEEIIQSMTKEDIRYREIVEDRLAELENKKPLDN